MRYVMVIMYVTIVLSFLVQHYFMSSICLSDITTYAIPTMGDPGPHSPEVQTRDLT